MEYQKAKAEVVLFDNSDVVTTSDCNGNHLDKQNCDTNGWINANKG